MVALQTLKFLSCSEGRLGNLRIVDSPQTHVLMMGCKEFKIDNMVIQSPGNSPNTDGIHIQSSEDLNITNTKIGSGILFLYLCSSLNRLPDTFVFDLNIHTYIYICTPCNELC